jgi:hypothetical protein
LQSTDGVGTWHLAGTLRVHGTYTDNEVMEHAPWTRVLFCKDIRTSKHRIVSPRRSRHMDALGVTGTRLAMENACLQPPIKTGTGFSPVSRKKLPR